MSESNHEGPPPETETNVGNSELPTLAKIVLILQLLLTCLVLIIWGAWATWGRFPYSLVASGVVFGPIVLLCVVATFGLGNGKLFGWVTAIVGNAAISLVLGLTAGPLCIIPLGFLIFLLTPKVREFYMRNYYE